MHTNPLCNPVYQVKSKETRLSGVTGENSDHHSQFPALFLEMVPNRFTYVCSREVARSIIIIIVY